jgi:hypothetical protein
MSKVNIILKYKHLIKRGSFLHTPLLIIIIIMIISLISASDDDNEDMRDI